jgi:hypothetical protein
MLELRLIAGGRAPGSSPAPPLRLDASARRPGVAHERLELHLDAPASTTISRLLVADRLPIALLAVIAIESERALHAAARGRDAGALARGLDWAARRAPPPRRCTQLDAYAAALRRAELPTREPSPGRVELLVPYHTLVAWEIAAEAASMRLTEWACARLAETGAGRRLWEAAAAERGEMLAEWIALQAADDPANS